MESTNYETLWLIRDAELEANMKLFLIMVELRGTMYATWQRNAKDMGFKKDTYFKTRKKVLDADLVDATRQHNGSTIYTLNLENIKTLPHTSDSEIQNDSVTANDDSVLANDDSVLANDDSVLANDDSVLANDDSVLANDDSVFQNAHSARPETKVEHLRDNTEGRTSKEKHIRESSKGNNIKGLKDFLKKDSEIQNAGRDSLVDNASSCMDTSPETSLASVSSNEDCLIDTDSLALDSNSLDTNRGEADTSIPLATSGAGEERTIPHSEIQNRVDSKIRRKNPNFWGLAVVPSEWLKRKINIAYRCKDKGEAIIELHRARNPYPHLEYQEWVDAVLNEPELIAAGYTEAEEW